MKVEEKDATTNWPRSGIHSRDADCNLFLKHWSCFVAVFEPNIVLCFFCWSWFKVQVTSVADIPMVSTLRKMRHIWKLPDAWDKFPHDIMKGQGRPDPQIENRLHTYGKNATSSDRNYPILKNCSQVDMQTPERSITDGVRREVATVVVRVYDAVSVAKDSLVLSRVEIALISIHTSSGWDL